MSEVKWKKEYYRGSNQLHCEIPFVNGQRHGVARGYYSDGELYWETPYANGHQHGIEKWYSSDGELYHENPFVNGRLHGVERWYNKDSTTEEKALWIRDRQRNDLLGDEHKLARLMLLGEES